MENFLEFGLKLQLPQTAVLCIQGLHILPFDDMKGYFWFPEFDWISGQEWDSTHPTVQKGLFESKNRVLQFLKKAVLEDSKELHWKSNQIFLFGFGQGGTFVCELGLECGGIVSVSGPPISFKTDIKSPTLITIDRHSHPTKGSSQKITWVRIESKSRIQMPQDRLEMKYIFEFLGKRLGLRSMALETSPDIIQLN